MLGGTVPDGLTDPETTSPEHLGLFSKKCTELIGKITFLFNETNIFPPLSLLV